MSVPELVVSVEVNCSPAVESVEAFAIANEPVKTAAEVSAYEPLENVIAKPVFNVFIPRE